MTIAVLPTHKAAKSRPQAKPKVVVIDDDESMRELLKLHLRNGGYEPFAAEDAIVGGHMILAKRPSLIICDVDMPYMSGFEFVAALKADPETRHIPVVFLSVHDDVADQAGKLGAEAYLRKPVSVDKLLEVVGLLSA